MGLRKALLIRLSWFLVLTLALIQVFAYTSVQTDISSFMPSGSNEKQRQLLQEFQQGSASRLWLIAITGADDGADELQITSQSQKMAAGLRQSGLFSSVVNGASVVDASVTQRLFSYRYLLDETMSQDSFSVSELRHAFQQRLEEMASPFSSFSQRLLVSDPTAAMLRVSDSLQGSQSALESSNGVWYSNKDKRSLLIASSKEPGSNIDAQERVYKFIQSTYEQSKGDSNSSLTVSGSPLFAVVARDSIRKESRQFSIAAGLFMLLFMFIVFRSGTMVLLTMLPLAGGLLMATALVSLLYGSIHGITLAFGITLLGVAIDYPVHLLMHARKGKSLQQAAIRIWPVLRLGVMTTALGYGAMVWTDFSGLSQLGVFSLTGLITAALITRTLLPVLKKNVIRHRAGLEFVVLTKKNRIWLRLTGIALIAFMLVSMVSLVKHTSFLPEDIWSNDIATLSPVPIELVQRDRLLRSSLGVPESSSLIRVEGKNIEQVLRTQELLQPVLAEAISKNYLSGTQSATDLLPSLQIQQYRQSLLPDREILSKRMHDALQSLPFRPESFEPFLDAVEEAKSLKHLKPEDLRDSSLAAAFDGLLSINKSRVSGVIRLTGLEDPAALEELVKESGIPQVAFINLKSSTNELILEFRQEMLSRIGWVAAVILLVLCVGLRDLRRSLKVIVPVILAVLFAAMVPLWLGEPLNLFHLVSLLLVTGLGLDYALFFSSIRDNREESAIVTFSLIICGISSLVVFAMLAFSSIPVLHSIGITVASGVVAAFVLSWLFSEKQVKA